ncbi:MAG: ComEC/Rec2 family competence protein [Candidatus Moranbacteria bacterium]|nr:ComEC/Rec2 family competence protein [Candidatus Moranbacteria bacterium]
MNYIFQFSLLILVIINISVFWGNKKARLAGFCVLFLACGIWLTDKKMEKLNYLDLAGQNFSGTALVIKEPVPKDGYQQVIVKSGQGDKFLLNTASFPEYKYGDKIKLACNLEIPQKQEDFDYRMYLAKDGIYYLCKSPKILILSRNQGSLFYASVLKIKNKLLDNINQLMPAPESGLLVGLLIGGSAQLPKELQNNFSKTGLTHIVAVSGYNVTIIAEYLLLFGIFMGLWRKQALWFALIGIFLFVVMTGMPSSAVRAGIMGSLLIWAMKNGRLANSTNAIVFAAAVMLLLNPLLLRYDVGFQLSFLATLGIVYFSPFLEIQMIKKHKTFGLWEVIILSLSAQIFVVPILIYNFHQLSLLSLLANALVLPIIPITMLLGFLAVAAEFIFHPLAILFSWIAFLPLKYEVEIINFLGSLKYSAVAINNFSWIWVALWYLLLFLAVFLLKKRKKRTI